MLLDAAQDLGAVDLAQHHLRHPETGHRVRHSPAVAVEHRQRVQVDVAVGGGGVQAEGDRVDPEVAMGELHALGTRGRARGVVDRRGRVLVRRLPRHGIAFGTQQPVVVVLAEQEAVLDRGAGGFGEEVLVLGVGEEDRSAAMLDDVGDLGGLQPEVDGHADPSVRGDAEEQFQQPGGVLADDGDALAASHAELVEAGGQRPAAHGEPAVGLLAEASRPAGSARR